MSTQPRFEVLRVWRTHQFVEMDVRFKNGEEDLCVFNKDEYENWLSDSDRLKFTDTDGYDLPEYTKSEYWEQAHERTINQDAYEFIVLRNPEEIFEGVSKDLIEILDDYQSF